MEGKKDDDPERIHSSSPNSSRVLSRHMGQHTMYNPWRPLSAAATALFLFILLVIKVRTHGVNADGQIPSDVGLVQVRVNNTCISVETFLETSVEVVQEPMYKKSYKWCASVPPRCPTYVQSWHMATRIRVEPKNRTVTRCCTGYVSSTNKVCIPVCSLGCLHGRCSAPDTCSCEPGYAGKICDFKTAEFYATAPIGRLGETGFVLTDDLSDSSDNDAKSIPISLPYETATILAYDSNNMDVHSPLQVAMMVAEHDNVKVMNVEQFSDNDMISEEETYAYVGQDDAEYIETTPDVTDDTLTYDEYATNELNDTLVFNRSRMSYFPELINAERGIQAYLKNRHLSVLCYGILTLSIITISLALWVLSIKQVKKRTTVAIVSTYRKSNPNAAGDQDQVVVTYKGMRPALRLHTRSFHFADPSHSLTSRNGVLPAADANVVGTTLDSVAFAARCDAIRKLWEGKNFSSAGLKAIYDRPSTPRSQDSGRSTLSNIHQVISSIPEPIYETIVDLVDDSYETPVKTLGAGHLYRPIPDLDPKRNELHIDIPHNYHPLIDVPVRFGGLLSVDASTNKSEDSISMGLDRAKGHVVKRSEFMTRAVMQDKEPDIDNKNAVQANDYTEDDSDDSDCLYEAGVEVSENPQ